MNVPLGPDGSAEVLLCQTVDADAAMVALTSAGDAIRTRMSGGVDGGGGGGGGMEWHEGGDALVRSSLPCVVLVCTMCAMRVSYYARARACVCVCVYPCMVFAALRVRAHDYSSYIFHLTFFCSLSPTPLSLSALSSCPLTVFPSCLSSVVFWSPVLPSSLLSPPLTFSSPSFPFFPLLSLFSPLCRVLVPCCCCSSSVLLVLLLVLRFLLLPSRSPSRRSSTIPPRKKPVVPRSAPACTK